MRRVPGYPGARRIVYPPTRPIHRQPQGAAIDTKQLAAAAAWLADHKKAEGVVVYDVGERFKVADYYVIASGTSRPHVKALYDELHVRLKAAGEMHRPVEGADLGWWILLDFGTVVVHLLQPDAREYYDLDHLYGECDELDWRSIELPEIPDPVHHRRLAE